MNSEELFDNIIDKIDREGGSMSRSQYIEFIERLGSEIKCRQDCIDEEEANQGN